MSQSTLAVYSDLEAVYRPERVWAEGRAFALVVAHFLSGAGAGAWLLGLLLDLRLTSGSGARHRGPGRRRAPGLPRAPGAGLEDDEAAAGSWISRGLWSMMVFVPDRRALPGRRVRGLEHRWRPSRSSCW